MTGLQGANILGSKIEIEPYKKFTTKPASGDLNTLFIKNIPSDTTDEELLEEFN